MMRPDETVTPLEDDGGVPPDPPTFGYRILLSDTFDQVLAGQGAEADLGRLLDVAFARGRVLLQARAGAGKSFTLRRLVQEARRREVRVVEVLAVDWVATTSSGDQGATWSSLMAALPASAAPATALDELGGDDRIVLVIDGLNEVESRHVTGILDAVENLASRFPRLGVVIADRLNRRPVDEGRWQLATLTVVPHDEVLTLVPSATPELLTLLDSPFYLDQARVEGVGAGTHRELLLRQIGVGGSDLARLADAVFEGYAVDGSRLLDRDRFVAAVGEDVVAALQSSGVLREHRRAVLFDHHLQSDFLAAHSLADEPDRWRGSTFDVLTFEASSFDALALLLDDSDAGLSDLLVRQVYDWNFYASAYLVSEGDAVGHQVSIEMRTVLTAMLAERRFDRFAKTARQVTDALRLQIGPDASPYLEAESSEEVVALVAAVESDVEWFVRWRALFSKAGPELTVDDALQITDQDGLLGWTAANVLKRKDLDEEVTAVLLVLLDVAESTVRWRAVHALGAASSEVIEPLIDRLRSDAEPWVQYGALRSLIEVAAGGDTEVRRKVFAALAGLGAHIAGTRRLAIEAERAMVLVDPPAGWAEDAGILLEVLWAESTSVEAQDVWRSVSARLRDAEVLTS